jgi:FkbM family methyltransferase
MSSFFILQKNNIVDNADDQVIVLKKNTYLLPSSNLSYYVTHGLFESTLIAWCAQFCNKNSVFLDIGAHTGTYSISLSKYCKQVYAFEPQKKTFYALCGSVALSNIDNIECINYGLGSKEQIGNSTLKIVSIDGGGSSMHATSGIIKEETIKVKTLDSFNIDGISLIKIDVEDNELFVLMGGVETIIRSNYPHICFECNTESENKKKLFNFLNEINYNIVAITSTTNMFLAYKKK